MQGRYRRSCKDNFLIFLRGGGHRYQFSQNLIKFEFFLVEIVWT